MQLIVAFMLVFSIFQGSMCELDINLGPMDSSGPCYCAVFDKLQPKNDEEPLIKQRPMNVSCDEFGLRTCLKICSALAEAAKVRGPILLCSAVQHAVNLKPSVFVRSCDDEKWVYTGLTGQDFICCHEGLPVQCENFEKHVTPHTE